MSLVAPSLVVAATDAIAVPIRLNRSQRVVRLPGLNRIPRMCVMADDLLLQLSRKSVERAQA